MAFCMAASAEESPVAKLSKTKFHCPLLKKSGQYFVFSVPLTAVPQKLFLYFLPSIAFHMAISAELLPINRLNYFNDIIVNHPEI